MNRSILALVLQVAAAAAALDTPAALAQPVSTAVAGGEATPATTQPADLEALMAGMAETPGVVAEFTEIKKLAILDAPLETRGTLYFIPPNRMARRVSYPGTSSFVIDGDRLAFEDETGGDDVDLGSNPVARVFVENFIVLFNGDLAELRRRYDPTLTVDGDQWVLELKPRGQALAKMIESIAMRGSGRTMQSMTLREVGGDVTETRFTKVDPNHRFSQSEIARYFRAETVSP